MFDTELIRSALRLSVPLGLAALGGTISERSGVVNIGLEGQMLMGAFAGYAGAMLTGSAWGGSIIGCSAGALLGLTHGLLTQRFRADQVVSGAAVNLFASGSTIYLMHRFFPDTPSCTPFASVSASWLERIPVIGPVMNDQSPFVWLLILMLIAMHHLMNHSGWGLRIRACGESASHSRLAGLPVRRIRMICVGISGALAGLSGVYLSISQMNVYSDNMSAGKGFVALAAVIFGRWTPLGVVGASLGFGLLDAMQQRLQGSLFRGVEIPSELFLALPYILTVIVLAGFAGRSKAPADLGKPEE